MQGKEYYGMKNWSRGEAGDSGKGMPSPERRLKMTGSW
jgi:hypothetical protein